MASKSIYKIVPIILATGSCSRLWPLSRKSFPKQFLNLADKFIEKPNKKNTKYFIEDKKYYWDNEMFVFKATCILDEIKNFLADNEFIPLVLRSINPEKYIYDYYSDRPLGWYSYNTELVYLPFLAYCLSL